MSSVHDVAAYILRRLGPMSAMKMQKLVFYSQAWHLAWHGRPLFKARIEAWAQGPVIRELYREHRRMYNVSSWPRGNPADLSLDARQTIDAVLNYYGDKTAFWLSELAHREDPWLQAREGYPSGARSEREISEAAIKEYYGALAHG
jgi:uncharacterized phage-associated protein